MMKRMSIKPLVEHYVLFLAILEAKVKINTWHIINRSRIKNIRSAVLNHTKVAYVLELSCFIFDDTNNKFVVRVLEIRIPYCHGHRCQKYQFKNMILRIHDFYYKYKVL